jgi:hypothetical protein
MGALQDEMHPEQTSVEQATLEQTTRTADEVMNDTLATSFEEEEEGHGEEWDEEDGVSSSRSTTSSLLFLN